MDSKTFILLLLQCQYWRQH